MLDGVTLGGSLQRIAGTEVVPVADRKPLFADGQDANNDTKATGFSRLSALGPQELAAEMTNVLATLGCAYAIGTNASEVQVRLDDGLFESSAARTDRFLAALGLEKSTLIDPRIPKRALSFDLGRARLTIEPPMNAQPTLLELARTAIKDRRKTAELVTHSDVNLSGNFGGMIRKRGLETHCRDLGAPFVSMMQSLGGNDRILLLGAGEARFAKEYLTGDFDRAPREDDARRLAARPLSEKASIVSVDLGKPPADVDHPKHVFHTGFFSSIPNEKLGKFQAIVDVLGCLTYTSTLSQDLQKALDVLEEGGRLFVRTTDSVVIYQNDRLLSLPEWLKTIDGLEVDFHKPEGVTDGAYLHFSVRKTGDIRVPDLSLIFEASHFPRALSTVHIFAPT